MILIALASWRARLRVERLLARPLGYADDWRRGPKAGYALVSEEEYGQIMQVPGVTRAQPLRHAPHQLALPLSQERR